MDINNQNQNENPRPRRRRRYNWKRIGQFFGCVILLFASFFWLASVIFDKFLSPPHEKIIKPEPTVAALQEEKLEERINILLLGVDEGDSEAAADEPKRTDAMVLLSVDPQKEMVATLSLPRDTKVVLPGHRDPEKLNAAYAFGGVVNAKHTVSRLLGVNVHYYAKADWQGFIKLVDMIGGVDIYVDRDMYYEDPYANLVIDIKKGSQHMDGETAGKYVRFRADELGDIGRVQRQQKFLRAAGSQFFTLGNLTNIGTIMATMEDYVETDLNTMVMLKILRSFRLFGEDKLRSGMLYGEFNDDYYGSFWYASPENVCKSLDELGIPYNKQAVYEYAVQK